MFYHFFFLPLGTDVRRRSRPWLTGVLIGILIAVHVAVERRWIAGATLWQLALIPAEPKLWAPVTACFLHAGWWHLAGNVLYLALFGAPLEDRLGRARMATVYLTAGAGALMVQAIVALRFMPGLAWAPIVGASGAVAGLLGAFWVRLPHARVRVGAALLLLLHGLHKVQVRMVNAAAAILVWVLLQLVYALAAGSSGQVAYWAHLGGLALGAGLAAVGKAWDHGANERRLVRGRRYLQRGRGFAAAGELETYLERCPTDAPVWALMGRAYCLAGARGRAIEAYRRGLVEALAVGGDEQPVQIYLEMDRMLPGEVLAPAVQLELASRLEGAGEFDAALSALVDLLRVAPEHPAARAALQRAQRLATLSGDQHLGARLRAEFGHAG